MMQFESNSLKQKYSIKVLCFGKYLKTETNIFKSYNNSPLNIYIYVQILFTMYRLKASTYIVARYVLCTCTLGINIVVVIYINRIKTTFDFNFELYQAFKQHRNL